ncbi:MAG: class I SAM-dependent methyltransferase [Kiritimatiellia bacterium]|nr:class I SAM-dependent methyltransferase [Kiritimatiellia bacterium]
MATIGTQSPLLERIRSRYLSVSDKCWDLRLGVKTRRPYECKELGFTNPECHRYTPAEYGDLHKAMKRLDIRAGEDVFLDYGSGLGRAVFVAAMQPFRRAIGVELSPLLVRLADENLRRAGYSFSCKHIMFVASDARTFALPDDVSHILLYSPFSGQVLRDVFTQLRRSLERAPRDVTVVYKNPEAFEEWSMGLFEEYDAFKSPTGHRVCFYRHRSDVRR